MGMQIPDLISMLSPGRPNCAAHVCFCTRRDYSLTMEDWKTWTCYTSYIALHDVDVDPTILKMWGHLRAAATHYLTYTDGQHQAKYIDRAQDELCRYCAMCEDHFGQHELLTHQSHQLTWHVPEQLRKCGPGAMATEAWVERMCGGFKKITRYRCTRHPERSAVGHMLFGQALDDLGMKHGVTAAYDAAMAKQVSSSVRAQRKRDKRAELQDNPKAVHFLVGALEDITREGDLVRVDHH